MKHHIHVYRVVEKFEIDIEGDNEQAARANAIAKAKSGEIHAQKSECEYLAISFGDDGGVTARK